MEHNIINKENEITSFAETGQNDQPITADLATDKVCVIMPPGCGKSWNHGRKCLLELDAVVSTRATSELSSLRDIGKSHCIWYDHDKTKASLLNEVWLPGHVYMLPSAELANAAGFKIICAIVVDKRTWFSNMTPRGADKILEYTPCYNNAVLREDCVYLSGNSEVELFLDKLSDELRLNATTNVRKNEDRGLT